jgi:hypothetical protein
MSVLRLGDAEPYFVELPSSCVMRSPVVTAPSDADETMAAYLAMTPVL